MQEKSGKYGEEFCVDYNHTKTVCVAFSRWKVEVKALLKTSVKLCGATLKWVDKINQLGNHFEYNLSATK